MVSKQVKELRLKIDEIDNQILGLLNKRTELVLEIGKIKKELRSDFYVLEREQEIYNRLTEINKGPFPTSALKPVFREIISASLSLEKLLKVAYLGPEATFTQLAALQQFGQSAIFLQAKSIPEIFDQVEREQADYGVVPIENSTEGSVYQTLDMFIDSPLKICAEVLLKISHHLLSKTGEIKDIKKIYSHPQALAQCNAYLTSHFPHLPLVETSSTAMAAQKAFEDSTIAAVAGEFAATYYGLKVIAPKIEDNIYNFTRFWVIGKKSPAGSGKDKTSVMFAIKDEVGALHQVLEPFAQNQINLTKIESRPFKNKLWEYIFFLDLEGHLSDEKIENALEELKKKAFFLKILGSYPLSS